MPLAIGFHPQFRKPNDRIRRATSGAFLSVGASHRVGARIEQDSDGETRLIEQFL